MNARIYGDGELASALRAAPGLSPCNVLALDHWDERRVSAHEQQVPYQPYLTVWQEPGAVWAGPLRLPDRCGCALCADIRRTAIHPYRAAFLAVRNCTAALTPLQISQVYALLHAARSGASEQRCLWHLDLQTLRARLHWLLPVSDCPQCGRRPDDRSPAGLTLPAVPKEAPRRYRAPSGTLEQHWQALYVDRELGMVRDVSVHPVSLFYEVGAHAGMPGFDEVELTSGRGISPPKSRLSAVAEALERYGGIRPSGKRTVIRAAYTQVRDCAVNPLTLGSHESGLQPSASGLQPFDPEVSVPWVWASSLTGRGARLVPEHCAYYGLPLETRGARFFYETSNGCAVGQSLTEAVLFGLLELIERDAFLLSWHARLPLRSIDLTRECPVETRWRVERIEALTGYRILAFDMTLDLGIPAVWVMAVDHQDRPLHPKSLHAAAAHLDPVAALHSALHELAPGIPYAQQQYASRRERLLDQLAHPEKIEKMQDHAALYWLPESFNRLDFLTQTVPATTLNALRACAPAPMTDLREDLGLLLQRFSAAGLDVWMVDQTAPEHRAGQLCCVKMIVPGLLPMTFGHVHRRLGGLPRLHSVPPRFGQTAPMPLNLHPHPFP